MAAPLLIDFATIDMAGIALSRERVGEINPQSGDMRQLDYVIWLAPDASLGLGVKHVRDDEFWVPGHIPGRPLLPGVLMIEAAAQMSSILFQMKGTKFPFIGFTRCDNVAFRGQVVPGDTLYILAREVDFGKRRFIAEAQGVVNGKIVFEVQITGMVM